MSSNVTVTNESITLPVIKCNSCKGEFTVIYYHSKEPFRALIGLLIGRPDYCPRCGIQIDHWRSLD
jgi:hypothetical protein